MCGGRAGVTRAGAGEGGDAVKETFLRWWRDRRGIDDGNPFIVIGIVMFMALMLLLAGGDP